MEHGCKGAYNELVATTWLLKNGYHVFRNVSAHGPVDLIAMKGSEVMLIDVKGGIDKNHQPTLTEKQIALGIKVVIVYVDGTCAFGASLQITRCEVPCKRCSKLFVAKYQRAKFCSKTCRQSYHNDKNRTLTGHKQPVVRLN